MPHTAAIVFITGQLCDKRIWRAQADLLSSVADISFACPDSEDTVAEAATRILGEAPATFSLVAHAMGGFVALEMMRQAPQRIARLALLATNAEPDDPAQLPRRLEYRQMVEDGRFDELISQRYPLVLHPALVTDPQYRKIVDDMAHAIGPERFLHQQSIVLSRPDSRPHLHAVRCPCLLIVGRQDRLASVEQHREIAALVASAELHILEDCGHFSPLEKPQQVNQLLSQWLVRTH